jgi:hypothetical protein
MLVTTYETTRHIQEDRNLELKNWRIGGEGREGGVVSVRLKLHEVWY